MLNFGRAFWSPSLLQRARESPMLFPMDTPDHASHMHVKILDDILFQELDGEAVLLSTRTGEYFGLDAVGLRMFSLLQRHGRVDRVIDAIVAEYEVEAERARRDVTDFVERLSSEGLVDVYSN